MIKRPGLYTLAAEEYHADPAPEPSLSSSIIGQLLITPRHAWTAHPRLNPAYEPESNSDMDFGTAAHRLLLGNGRDFVVVDAADWRTKAAQEARKQARAQGLAAILTEDARRAEAMASAAREQLELIDDCHDAFRGNGAAELTVAWQEATIDGCDPVWCRGLIDWLPKRRESGHIVIYDLKTTKLPITPDSIGAYLFNRGYDIPAAMYERGLEAIFGDAAGLVVMRFVIQSREPPYLLLVAEIEPAGMMIGRKKVAYAIELWRRCLYSQTWPGFPAQIVRAEMPSWYESRWLAREMAEDGDPANDPYLIGSRWVPPESPKPLVLE